MSDHISFNLSKKGFNVSKYVPFGPIKEMIPYLIRRAEENSSVKGQTSRELNLINQELNRRKKLIYLKSTNLTLELHDSKINSKSSSLYLFFNEYI